MTRPSWPNLLNFSNFPSWGPAQDLGASELKLVVFGLHLLALAAVHHVRAAVGLLALITAVGLHLLAVAAVHHVHVAVGLHLLTLAAVGRQLLALAVLVPNPLINYASSLIPPHPPALNYASSHLKLRRTK